MNQSEVKLINSIKVSHLFPKELSIHIVYYIYISCIELLIQLQISLQIANILLHLRG